MKKVGVLTDKTGPAYAEAILLVHIIINHTSNVGCRCSLFKLRFKLITYLKLVSETK